MQTVLLWNRRALGVGDGVQHEFFKFHPLCEACEHIQATLHGVSLLSEAEQYSERRQPQHAYISSPDLLFADISRVVALRDHEE